MDTENDFTSNGQKVDLDEIVAAEGTFRKLVYGCRASGSALPFPDAWFSCYVSNLVLQLIDSPTNQIQEAYRVLKPGSAACFTVWGRPENSLMFTAANEGKRLLNPDVEAEEPLPVSDMFNVGRDIEQFLTHFQEAGFNQVKRWYQPQNHAYRTGEEFFNLSQNPAVHNQPEEMKNATKTAYDNISGANTPDLKVFEVMIILAFKD